MAKEKQIVGKPKKFIWIFICGYFLIVAGYYWGKGAGERMGLEYRFWVDACFRIWVWFIPILFIGALMLKTCIRQWKGKSPWRLVLSVLLIGYVGVAAYASLFYALICAFSMTCDERMPDGNLVVSVPYGMESIRHYAEAVGLLYRRNFTFDEKRTAESLSKIYDVTFQPIREENGQWIYGSDEYPEIEVSNIYYGFTEVSYLDSNFELVLTSKMLEKHQDVFTSRGVELVPYIYGQSEVNPEGQEIYAAVLVSKENKGRAAEAIAEFIKVTLLEDQRPDGKSNWDCVNGSIFLVQVTKEEGKYESIRNISFARKPKYFWVYDASVVASDIEEKISQSQELLKLRNNS